MLPLPVAMEVGTRRWRTSSAHAPSLHRLRRLRSSAAVAGRHEGGPSLLSLLLLLLLAMATAAAAAARPPPLDLRGLPPATPAPM